MRRRALAPAAQPAPPCRSSKLVGHCVPHQWRGDHPGRCTRHSRHRLVQRDYLRADAVGTRRTAGPDHLAAAKQIGRVSVRRVRTAALEGGAEDGWAQAIEIAADPATPWWFRSATPSAPRRPPAHPGHLSQYRLQPNRGMLAFKSRPPRRVAAASRPPPSGSYHAGKVCACGVVERRSSSPRRARVRSQSNTTPPTRTWMLKGNYRALIFA